MRLASSLSAIVVSSAAFAGIFHGPALQASGSASDMSASAIMPTVTKVLDQPALREPIQSATRDAVATIRGSLVDFINELKVKPGLGAHQATKRPATPATAQDIDNVTAPVNPKLGNVHIIVRPARPMTEVERAQALAERAMFERLKAQENDTEEADVALVQAMQRLRGMAAP